MTLASLQPSLTLKEVVCYPTIGGIKLILLKDFLKGIRDDAYPDDWRYTHALLYGAVEAEVRNTLKDCVKAVIKNLTAGVHLRTHTYRAHKLSL